MKDLFDDYYFGGDRKAYKPFMVYITDISGSLFLRRFKAETEEQILKSLSYFMHNNPKRFIKVCEYDDFEYLMEQSECVHYLVLDKIVSIQIKEDEYYEEEGH